MNLIDKLKERNGVRSIIVPSGMTSAISHQPNADELHEDVLELAYRAYEAQGARAFELPRAHAAIHEAGHAVFYCACGVEVEMVEVWPVPQDRQCWGGLTTIADAKEWVVSKDTDPADDCAQIRFQIAGWLSELLFLGKELRLASSLDEVVLAQSIARTVAWKTDKHPTIVFTENCAIVRDVLLRNEPVVRAIAGKLSTRFRKKLLGASLAKILDGVEPAAPVKMKNASATTTEAFQFYSPDQGMNGTNSRPKE